jgi:hypothetical protein
MEAIISQAMEYVVAFATDLLLPTMLFTFATAIILRLLIFYTIRREHWFASEFEKRVHRFLDENRSSTNLSFFVVAKRLLEKTYYELFEVRAIMRRRKLDAITPLSDRMFMIQHGTARLVRDTLKQIRNLKYGNGQPKLLEISKTVFETNPCFNRVFGVLPASLFNDILAVLPGIFIVGGIFGTFLGIMRALPELSGMDLQDAEATKQVMDQFLLRTSFSMAASVMGIMISVAMTFINTMFSVEKLFVDIVNRYENSLDMLWNRCDSNRLPETIEFDEHKDPIEALAEQSVDNELRKHEKVELKEAS